jgi:RimJ/RimL family protein N-acetyltransferase
MAIPGSLRDVQLRRSIGAGPRSLGCLRQRALIGYCCFGEPARVPGAIAESGTLDIGYGLAPDRVARGDGSRFLAAIVDFASERWEHRRFRVYVLEWNKRSHKVAARNGFVDGPTINSEEGRFLVMCRERAHTCASDD